MRGAHLSKTAKGGAAVLLLAHKKPKLGQPPMSKPLRYEQPPKLSRSEIENELASGDPDRMFRALLAASYTEPATWVEEQCFKFAAHPIETVRRAAALVLGNIAFVHGPSDLERVLYTLQELQQEPELRAVAEESLMFVRHAARHRMH